MIIKIGFLFPLTLIISLAVPFPALADGIIVPAPCPQPGGCPVPSPMVQLEIIYHRVEVVIEDQIAITRVDQVFANPNDWVVEGIYFFPVPVDAAISSFTLWVDGKPVKGELLEAGKAREVYQQIVMDLRDPALLEYAGRGTLRASIFPISPHEERRVELEYSQVLRSDNGLVNYVYPLSTEKFSITPLEQVSILVDIRTDKSIRAVYSPSHPVAVDRQSATHVKASYEANHVLPDTDFSLYYSQGESQALHLFSYRDPLDAEDPDGFFLLLMAPSIEAENQSLPKDVILVLDRSGSMEGEKFSQAQAAVRYILNHLNPQDAFNLVAFSSDLQVYAEELQPASQAGNAIEWVGRLSAVGGTDINRALLEAVALVNPERPSYLIFLTDGLPTVGEVESEHILGNLEATVPESIRLFAFGVGYDVDTFLLDSLSEEHQGISFYIKPEEQLDEVLSMFFSKISAPVLTDIELEFGGLGVYDLYPYPLPDLFRNSQVIALGRYREAGEVDILLSGQVAGTEQSFTFPGQVFIAKSPPGDPLASVLPRLWATRKIGYLLKQVRLHGPEQETVDQIVGLSIRYGIVTPYTSYLVTEDQPLGQAAREQLVEKSLEVMKMPAAVSGSDAVHKALGEQELFMAESLLLMEQSDQMAEHDQSMLSGQIRAAGGRTYLLQGSTWVDTAFDQARMKITPVTFLSPKYFELVKKYPSLGATFALGPSVITLVGDQAYEVVDSETLLDLPGAQADPVQDTSISQTSQTRMDATDRTREGSIMNTVPFPCQGGLLLVLLAGICLIWKKL